MTDVEDFTGYVAQGDSPQSGKFGEKFTTNVACNLKTVRVAPSCTATIVYLYDSGGQISGVQLASGAIVSEVATFTPYALTASTTYYVTADAEGATYSYRAGNDPTYPVVGTNVTFTARCSPGGEDTNGVNNIKSVTTEEIVAVKRSRGFIF